MSMIFSRHLLSVTIGLRCLHEMWSGPGMDNDEHLAMASLNSCLEKGGQSMLSFLGRLLRMAVLTRQLTAELYEQWRAFHKDESKLQGLSS